jgi:hypothetical protein
MKNTKINLIVFFSLIFQLNIFAQQFIVDTCIVADNGVNTIVIENQNDSPVILSFTINETFPLTIDKILEDIKELAVRDEVENYIAAWKYVSRLTFHTKPFTEQNWQHDVSYFINSIGGGFCDDRATILAKIWKAQGYDSRIINLRDHVVPEILINNNWQMYDPDMYLYYKDESTNKVLSVDELSSNTQVIQQGKLRGRRYAEAYKSKEYIRDETKWFLNSSSWDERFFLPNNSKLKVVQNKVPYIIVKLTNKSRGSIVLPFAPVFARGEGTISTLGKTKVITEDEEYIFESEKPIKNIHVRNVGNSLEIFYIVNPLFEIFDEENAIELNSNKNLIIESKKIKIDSSTRNKLAFYKKQSLTFHHIISKRMNRPLYKK